MKEDPITYFSNTSTARQFYSRTACLLATTALLYIPCIAFAADDEMLDLSTGSGWASGRGAGWAVSADGSVVAGYAVSVVGSFDRAFRWDATNGLVNLVDTVGSEWVSRRSTAEAISADGSVLAGFAEEGETFRDTVERAFRWDATNGMVNLSETVGSEWVLGPSKSYAVSADGLVVGGYALDSASSNGNAMSRAFRWDANTGMVNIADTDGSGTVGDSDSEWATTNSSANAISADGSVVAGRAMAGGYWRAFRWTEATGMVNLADTPGSDWVAGSSYAEAVSVDGSVVVGNARHSDYQDRAYRWTETTGMANLGDTVGSEWATRYSVASDVSADGSVVAGSANDDDNVTRAFRWTETTGMVNIADTDGSGTVGDSDSEWATGRSYGSFMSADGSAVAGWAYDMDAVYTRAFRWAETTGMVNLADTDGSGTIGDIESEWATGSSSVKAISADGSVLVGHARDGASVMRPFIYRFSASTGGVMLDAVNTQMGVVRSAAGQGAAVATVTAALSTALETELVVDSGDAPTIYTVSKQNTAPRNPMAVKVSALHSTNDDTGNLSIGLLAAAIGLSDQLTAGGFVALGDDGTSLGGFGFDGKLTSFGGFVRSTPIGDTGLTWKASVAESDGDVTITRDASLTGTEAGTGNSALSSLAGSVEVGYSMASDARVTTPFLRITRTTTTRDAYVEDGSISFPIYYSETTETVTTATLGLNSQSALDENNTLRIGFGLEADLNRSNTAITGISAIPSMTAFSVAAPEILNTSRAYFKAGLTHRFQSGSAVTFDVAVRQSAFSNSPTKTGGITYQMQF